MSPDQKELLKQAREANLLKIWAGSKRKLDASELAEIAHLIPAAAAPLTEPSVTFSDVRSRKVTSYTAPYRAYVSVYGLQEPHGIRTIKRWVKVGKVSTPPDLPPLDEKARMAVWWRLHMQGAPPRILLEFEKEAPVVATPAATLQDPAAAAENPAASIQQPAISSIASIELDAMIMGEGEAVAQARQVAKANFQRVAEASKGNDGKGDSDAYRRWFPIWKESVHLLNQLEREDRAARKASGDLLPRSQTLAEIAQLLEALRLMREAMPAKIVAELQKHARADGRIYRIRRILGVIEPLLVEAIQCVRGREGDVLLNIESLGSGREAEEQFRLQAA